MVNSLISMQKEKLTTKDKVKQIAGLAICFGADFAITMLLGSHMPIMKGWKKGLAAIGTFIIAMKVGEDCENYFYKVFDDTETVIKEAKTEIDQVVTNDIPEKTEAVETNGGQ